MPRDGQTQEERYIDLIVDAHQAELAHEDLTAQRLYAEADAMVAEYPLVAHSDSK